GAPCTWERKPSSAYFSARVIPDFASWRLASTSWVLLPMDETIPIPVMTTRLMIASPSGYVLYDGRRRPEVRLIGRRIAYVPGCDAAPCFKSPTRISLAR